MPIKATLEKYGIHSFLLPLFFILHNYLLYYGLASGGPAFWLFIQTELVFAGAFLLLLLITRHANRSLQLTTLLGFIVLFYGVFKDFFDDTLHVHLLARYTVLVPLLAVLAILLTVIIVRKKDFRKANLFQNSLLLLFILFELVQLVRLDTDNLLQHNPLLKNNRLNPDTLRVPSERPDVYFLVFDSYPGNGFLRDFLQYDNTPFDTALQKRGFYVVAHPRSNYNRTQFSISATLNMEYLDGVGPWSGAKYYNQAIQGIQHAVVPRVFMHDGYRMYNLSVFNWGPYPALMKENFLTLPENQMLLYNTLPVRFRHDIAWNFGSVENYLAPSRQQLYQKQDAEKMKAIKSYNDIAIDSLFKIPAADTAGPKFVYAHLYLPHIPLSYDSNGKPVREQSGTETPAMRKANMLSYLKYTNKVALRAVDSILQHARRPPIIIVQSDHGYRDLPAGMVPPMRYFDNYSAFYFPGKNYAMLNDSLTNINEFAVIFNTWFNTSIPMLKDSSVYLPFP